MRFIMKTICYHFSFLCEIFRLRLELSTKLENGRSEKGESSGKSPFFAPLGSGSAADQWKNRNLFSSCSTREHETRAQKQFRKFFHSCNAQWAPDKRTYWDALQRSAGDDLENICGSNPASLIPALGLGGATISTCQTEIFLSCSTDWKEAHLHNQWNVSYHILKNEN